MNTTPHLDTVRCKHCEAIVALIPRVAVVNRLAIRCLHCGVVAIVHPPLKKPIDEPVRIEGIGSAALGV